LRDEKLLGRSANQLSGFNEKEQAVIELAEAMADTPSNVSAELHALLKKQFSEEQLFELSCPDRTRDLSRAFQSRL
jgi:alkylhydroperoxidase family enzyme